jgi:hypothetical protein
VLATGDDAVHRMNNDVLVERAHGPFQFVPFSVDISLAQPADSAHHEATTFVDSMAIIK